MAHFTSQLRANMPAIQPVPRVKMGIIERMIRLLRQGSLGFGLVAMITVCGVGRLLASLLAQGKVANVLCIGIVAIPLILIAGFLLQDEKKDSNQ